MIGSRRVQLIYSYLLYLLGFKQPRHAIEENSPSEYISKEINSLLQVLRTLTWLNELYLGAIDLHDSLMDRRGDRSLLGVYCKV